MPSLPECAAPLYGVPRRARSAHTLIVILRSFTLTMDPASPRPTERPLSFQDLILTLHQFWSKQGCAILQPYDQEIGAGTLSPHTTLRALGSTPWKAAYVQPCRRPSDGRYG